MIQKLKHWVWGRPIKYTEKVNRKIKFSINFKLGQIFNFHYSEIINSNEE